MKTRRSIYLIVGTFLIIVNLLLDLTGFYASDFQPGEAVYNAGTLIGGHILMIAGFFFLRAAYKLSKMINAMKDALLEKEIDSIGQ